MNRLEQYVYVFVRGVLYPVHVAALDRNMPGYARAEIVKYGSLYHEMSRQHEDRWKR